MESTTVELHGHHGRKNIEVLSIEEVAGECQITSHDHSAVRGWCGRSHLHCGRPWPRAVEARSVRLEEETPEKTQRSRVFWKSSVMYCNMLSRKSCGSTVTLPVELAPRVFALQWLSPVTKSVPSPNVAPYRQSQVPAPEGSYTSNAASVWTKGDS